MSDAVKPTEGELRRLRTENAALNEQLKLLVRTEQRLYRSQNELDRQFSRVRALAEFALHCAEIESSGEVVSGAALLLHDVFRIDDTTFVLLDNNATLARILSMDARGSARTQVLSVSPSWFDWIEQLDGCAMATVPRDSPQGGLDDRLRWFREGRGNEPAEEAAAAFSAQICVPLRHAKHKLVGFVLIGYDLAGRSYYKEHPGEPHLPFLELLGNHVARALSNAELTADLRERGRLIAETNRQLTQSLAQLRTSERRFRQLAEHIREVFWIADPWERRMTYLSPAFREIWGREPETDDDLLSIYLDGIHPDDRERFSMLHALHLEGRQTEVEYRVVRDDRTVRWIWDRGFPIRDDEDRVVLVCGIAEDVTERRHTSDELARLQRLETAGKIAGQIAHDFNNLLAPLTAYPQLLRERLRPGDRGREMLATMETAAKRIADINQQLLALGRRGHYNLTPLDLNAVTCEALGALRIDPAIRQDLDLADDLLTVLGGASQLTRVVTNLIANACDAMPEGGVLSISTRNVYVDEKQLGFQSVGRGEFVLLEVSDTGAGISSDVIDRVFDPFFSTKEMDRQRGSGLGLSVVHGVVTDHNGAVDVRSEPGRGSTFSVYVPVVRDRTIPSVREDEIPRGSGETVLLVDDDPLQLEVVERMLDSLGYRARCVSSGEEAIDTIAMFRPELVLLDMIMGGIDGTETLRRILEWKADQKVILVSGFARIDRVEQARTLGARAFLAKPLTCAPLARTIRAALDDAG